MLVPALLVGLMLFGFTPSANAGSALDQYVEEIPDPGGTPPKTPKPTEPPAPAPRPEKPVRSSGSPGGPTSVAPVGTVSDPGYSADASSGVAPEENTGKVRPHGERDRAGQDEARGNALEGHKQPNRAAAWSKAAETSGINAPLAAFVVLVAAAMVGVTVRRRVRGGSR